MLRLVREGTCWVKLSGAYRMTSAPCPWHDTDVFAAALVQANPERLLWGTDWPHPSVQVMPNDGDLVNQIPTWLPTEALRQQVLVDNPARLYGF
jgi:predicted TIM-barrel fold metal-dependent hydrolase